MDPLSLIGVITAVGPIITAGVKKVFKTDDIATKDARKIVHKTIPLVVALLAAGTSHVLAGMPVEQAIMAALAGGLSGSYVRDMDRHGLKLIQNLALLVSKKKGVKNVNPLWTKFVIEIDESLSSKNGLTSSKANMMN